MNMNIQQLLREEAITIAQQAFCIHDVPESVLIKYVRGHELLGLQFGASLRIPSYELARMHVDLNALEFVLRHRASELSAKFYLLSYLLECHGKTLATFLKPPKPMGFGGFFFSALGVACSCVWKAVKGMWLRRKYGL